MGELEDIGALYRSLSLDAPHLPEALLARLVTGERPEGEERTRVEAHLLACSRCRADLESLLAFRESVQAAAIGEAARVAEEERTLPSKQRPTRERRPSVWIPAFFALNALGLGMLYGKIGRSVSVVPPVAPSASPVEPTDLVRVRAAYEGQLAQARAREAALQKELDALKAQTGTLLPSGTRIVSATAGALKPRLQNALSWPTTKGAVSYRLVVMGSGVKPLFKAETRKTAWRPPTPLQPGLVYSAKVQALDSKKKPIGKPRFLQFSLAR